MQNRSRVSTLLLWTLAVGGVFLAPALGQDAHERRAHELMRGKHRPDRLLVRYARHAGGVDKEAVRLLMRADIVSELKFGAHDDNEVIYCYKLRNGLDADILKKVLQDPSVQYAEPDYIVHAYGTPNDPDFSLTWGLHNTGQTGGDADADIDAVEAWDITTGSDQVIVAIIDSGIDLSHPDLAGNLWVNPEEAGGQAGVDDDGNGFVDDLHGADWVRADGVPNGEDPHGSHVAGIIGAVGNDGVGIAGVSHNVSIMSLKFLDQNGEGYTSDAVEAMIYAKEKGAHIANHSYGGGAFSQALHEAMAAFPGMNFCAAGNEAANNDVIPSFPANSELPNNISVAGSDHRDGKYVWSNYGMNVHLAAPGVDIYSCVTNGGYETWNGTSMATPHVAGAAALILARYPSATNDEIRARLLFNVDAVPAFAGWIQTGGRLNVAQALVDDTIVPAAVLDLAGAVGNPGNSRIDLSWTATGDDYNSGTASAYDLRSSTSPINDGNFDAAKRATDTPTPGSLGTAESYTLTGLLPNTTYYVALRVVDNVGGRSAISNLVVVTTADAAILFEDDFEGNNLNKWASAQSPWGITGDGYQGSLGATDSPSGEYGINTEASLTTPVLDLSGISGAFLVFCHKWAFEDGWDWGHVEVSVNGGSSWTTLRSFTGTVTDFREAAIDLSIYDGNASVVVRWRVSTDYAINDDGWTIDKVLIFGSGQVPPPPPPTTVIASEDFESGGWNGGTGWADGWYGSGDANLRSDRSPHSGSWHIRLRKTGFLERKVDLSGETNVKLKVWCKIRSFEAGDQADIVVTPDGGANYYVIHTFTAADSDNSYHPYELDLSGFAMTADFWIGFEARAGKGDELYVDDIEVVSEGPPAVDEAPIITSTPGAGATVGNLYSYTVTATGSPTPTFSANVVPAWLSFDAGSGELSGTPAAGDIGAHNVEVTATNGVSPDATQSFIVNVDMAPAITSTPVTAVAVGNSYSYTLTADGSPAPSLSATTLPAWLSFNASTGELSGIPTADDAGDHNVQLTASNGVSPSATQSFSVSVNLAPAITSSALNSAQVGSGYSYVVTATGHPVPTLSATTLPGWLSFQPSSGVLSGTPGAGDVGDHSVVITASNGISPDATQSFSISVVMAPAITSTPLTGVAVGDLHSYTVTATGSPTPTLAATILPSWLNFNASTGLLSGAPTASEVGDHSVVITASNGISPDASQSFSISVEVVSPPTITSTPLTAAIAGSAYSYTVTADGSPAPSLSATTLPGWLSFNTSTGELSGTPTAGDVGDHAVEIVAVNGVQPDASQSFSITVDPAAGGTDTLTITKARYNRRKDHLTVEANSSDQPGAVLELFYSLDNGASWVGPATMPWNSGKGRYKLRLTGLPIKPDLVRVESSGGAIEERIVN